MTLTIEITPELESQLRAEAARRGVDAGEFVAQALRERLERAAGPSARALSAAESELLRRINEGLAAENWQRYRELLDKRRAETLTPGEQAELVRLSDRIEERNAQRVASLTELARLWQIPLPILMQQLGIQADVRS